MLFSNDIKQHIEELHAAGRSFSHIVMELSVNSGYAIHIAQRIAETVLDHEGNQLRLWRGDSESDCPDIDTSLEHGWIELPDARVGVAMEQLVPRVVLLNNFLSDQECNTLCEHARDRLKSAKVHVLDAIDGEVQDDFRSSEVTSLSEQQLPLIAVIERRIAALTGWPSACGEPLVIQRYRQDGKFEPHYDFFSEDTAYYDKEVSRGGQRLATMIIYLQQPERGGATYMANLGMRILPRKGSALFFSYPQANRQSGTLHGGDAVHSGEKWIMTKWFREKSAPAEPGTASVS